MKKPSDKDIIERAEKKFPACKSYWERHHQRFTKIKRFTRCHGPTGQWDDATYTARSQCKPPRLTLSENLLGPFVLQVANDLKKSDFGALVKPKDDGADPKLAKIRQGLHRGVQQIGGFRRALNPAIEDLIDGGLGAFRLITKYADPMSFQKEIEYMELDPTRLFHGDGTHRKSNFSDVTDSFVYEPYSEERFKAEFDKDPDNFLGQAGCNPIWGNGKTPWVTEYFFVEETPDTLVMFGDKEYLLSDFKEKMKGDAADIGLKVQELIAHDKDGQPITRPTTKRQIWWAKLAGKEVLKVEAWPGYCIPNFLATGRKVMVDGEMSYYGLAEPARDVQTAHNYAFSAMVERAGLAPKVRIFAAIESIPPSLRGVWDNLNTTDKMVAYYQSYNEAGQPLPSPHQEPPIQSDPAFANLRAMTVQGIKDVLGMWESSLGAQSNEKSGVAIQARERQSDTGNFDWGENLSVAAEHCFQVTDELLNKVYDEPTQVRIVGEDEKEEVQWAYALSEDGEKHDEYFDLNQGKYDILCKMSPGADTKREDQIRGMQMMFQADPEMASALAPEYIALQDWQNATKMAEIAKSFRSMKYPGLKTGDEQGQQQLPPEVQQHLQQMQMQMQQMQEALQKMGPENQQLKIENQSVKADKSIEAKRLEIEQFKADTERMKAEAEAGFKNDNLLLQSDKQAHSAAIDITKLGHDRAKVQSAHDLGVAAQEAQATAAQAGNTSTADDTAGTTMEG